MYLIRLRHLLCVLIIVYAIGVLATSTIQAQQMPAIQPSISYSGQQGGQWQHWGFVDMTKIYQQLPTTIQNTQTQMARTRPMSGADVKERPDGSDTMQLLIAEVIGEIDHA